MKDDKMEKQLDCEIILDLLPLYHDGVIRESTKKRIEHHLESCSSCRKEYETLRIHLPISASNSTTKDKFLKFLHQQRRLRCLRILYFLLFISIFLPWFTYNPRVMGYCWGSDFLKWFAFPLILIGVFLFTKLQSTKLLLIITEISLFTYLGILIFAFGRWQEVCNIISGFHWQDGLATALPGYWIAAGLSLLFFIIFQYDVWKRMR